MLVAGEGWSGQRPKVAWLFSTIEENLPFLQKGEIWRLRLTAQLLPGSDDPLSGLPGGSNVVGRMAQTLSASSPASWRERGQLCIQSLMSPLLDKKSESLVFSLSKLGTRDQ